MKHTKVNAQRQKKILTATNVALSPADAKRALIAQGITLTEFAKRHGFKYRTVSEVVRGVNKGLYGEGHRIAVALGIKHGEARA